MSEQIISWEWAHAAEPGFFTVTCPKCRQDVRVTDTRERLESQTCLCGNTWGITYAGVAWPPDPTVELLANCYQPVRGWDHFDLLRQQGVMDMVIVGRQNAGKTGAFPEFYYRRPLPTRRLISYSRARLLLQVLYSNMTPEQRAKMPWIHPPDVILTSTDTPDRLNRL